MSSVSSECLAILPEQCSVSESTFPESESSTVGKTRRKKNKQNFGLD